MKCFLRWAFVAMGIVLFALAGIIAYRTATFTSIQLPSEGPYLPEINIERAAETLSALVRLQTLSNPDVNQMDASGFLELHALLTERFPLIHKALRKEIFGGMSLLYHWKGQDAERKALVLLAHQDVVPAPDAESWEQPPFSGALADGFLWGRGTMDDKGSLAAILEAVETLLERGFRPQRDIYLCFGHDEEVGGWNGAAVMAAALESRGVRAEFTLDEGLAIVDGEMFGLPRPVALVSLTEKGYLSLELKTSGEPGHSSTPARETAIGVLAGAVTRIANTRMEARLSEPVRQMFRYLGPEMSLPMRIVLANLWLTKPLLLRQLAGARTTDATIRTTTAVTIIEGGETENVLPESARAVVNFRLLPGDSIAEVTEQTRKRIQDDRILLSPTCRPNESPEPSRADSPGFEAVHRTIKAVFPETLVAPGIMLGGSDSHHYAAITENTFGFMPLQMGKGDLERIHGRNERLNLEDFKRMIAFYILLIESAAG